MTHTQISSSPVPHFRSQISASVSGSNNSLRAPHRLVPLAGCSEDQSRYLTLPNLIDLSSYPMHQTTGEVHHQPRLPCQRLFLHLMYWSTRLPLPCRPTERSGAHRIGQGHALEREVRLRCSCRTGSPIGRVYMHQIVWWCGRRNAERMVMFSWILWTIRGLCSSLRLPYVDVVYIIHTGKYKISAVLKTNPKL